MTNNRAILDLLGIELPIIQAPMAGSNDWELAAAVSAAGGLGSIPCAMLDAERIAAEIEKLRAATDRPFNLNFFCHTPPVPDEAAQAAWRARLSGFYAEFGIDPAASPPAAARRPFDAAMCEVVERLRPPVVSFHFGLPSADLLARVKAAGCRVLSSATTVREAVWLERHGVDAVIAQGVEAGGHRGMFLSSDIATQVGTFALVPQVVDAVGVPVIAAGGIADGRGVAAAFALGAVAAQVGSAYLQCPEARTSAVHRAALARAADDSSALTNIFTGRPARGVVNRIMAEVGPMSDVAPAFPTATGAVQPLRSAGEAKGSGDFSPLWTGQAVALAKPEGAADLTRRLAAAGRERLAALA